MKQCNKQGKDFLGTNEASLDSGSTLEQSFERMQDGLITVMQIDSDPTSQSAVKQQSTVPVLTPQENTVIVEDCIEERAGLNQVFDQSDNLFTVKESSPSFCVVESVVQEQVLDFSEGDSFAISVDESSINSSVAFTEAVVEDSLHSSMSCAAELTQEMQVCVVDCTESAGGTFEIATLDSDDNESVCSVGSAENCVQTCDVAMECGGVVTVEEVPISPLQKALIRRG